jgi:phenylacetate-CoA ligase
MRRNEIYLDFSPIAISSTTETLLPMYRKLIEETFRAPMYDQYGCGETHSIAFECGEHMGLHITSEHVFVQTNNDDMGELIITNLDNYAMPIIRYENGDRIKLSKDNCSCGRKLPLISQIIGRTADSIVLKDGSEVHGVFFTDILNELRSFNLEFMNRFQVYQKTPGEITFYIESQYSLPKAFIEDLNSALGNFFSYHQIVVKKRIPEEKSGKFRYIKNEITHKP